MRIFITILLFLPYSMVYGQFTTPEVISSGGDSYSKIFGKMEVTFGEIVIETISENGTYLTQGFQQSNFFVSAIKEESEIENKGFNIFPNPTIDELNIVWDIKENVKIFLYDLTGKLLHTNEMTKTTLINLADYAAGAYLLRLSAGNVQKTAIIQKLK